MSSRPSIRARILLVVSGILLGIALGEVAARLVGFEYRPHMRNRVYFAEPDPVRGWRNRSGVSGPYGGDEFLTWVTLNEAGQRGRLHPIERTPGHDRIAILGDSQAWGDGVADDEVFAALLQRDDREVLNFSVIGYGNDQQLLTLESEVAPYRPDVVVIAAYLGNDLQDDVTLGTWQFRKPRYRLDDDGSLHLEGVPVEHSELLAFGVSVYRAAMRYSALLNAFAESAVDLRPLKPGGRRGWHVRKRPMRSIYTVPTEGDRLAVRLMVRLLVEAGARAREMGAVPVVLILPEHWQVEAAADPEWRAELRALGIDWRRPQKRLRRELEAAGLVVVDALQPLARVSRERPGRDSTFYPRWKHLTTVGHRVIADLLEPRVARLLQREKDGETRQPQHGVGGADGREVEIDPARSPEPDGARPHEAADATRGIAESERPGDDDGAVERDGPGDLEIAR
ncbi:MAG: hypothetical protein FJ144_01525 [Deltaproteobacteria bacterium]|nr:hypothetical protein [Deltaproteobacteria bacterium]